MDLQGLLNSLGPDERKKRDVWNKGKPIFENGIQYDPAIWRRDDNGHAIKWDEYGNRNSEYGWEIDHYPIPSALGGSGDLHNLRPLHCAANARHGGLLGAMLNR